MKADDAPSHLIYEEKEDGSAHYSCRATGGCLLVVLLIFGAIIALIVLRRTGVI